MFMLHDILKKLKKEFAHSRKGEERGTWFIYTLIAIIISFYFVQDLKSVSES